MTTFSYSTDSPANVRSRGARAPDVPRPQGTAARSGREGRRPRAGVPRRQADRQEAREPAGRAARRRPVRGRSRPARRRRGQGRAHAERRPARAGPGGERGSPRFGTVATTFPQAVTGTGAVGRDAGDGRGHRARRLPLRSLQDRRRPRRSRSRRITVLGSARADAKAAREAVKRGQVVAEAVCWARDLVNTPAGDMPPAEIAREAQKMARQVGLALQGVGQARAGEGRLRRDPRRRRRQREPSAADRALVQGRRHARRRSRSPARASRSTPAACRSRTPRAWRR